MSTIKPIRTEEDYQDALDRIGVLIDAEAGTPEGNDLDLLTDLVQHYEAKHVPLEYPSPVAAIHFRMDQAGLTQRDLIPLLGSRAKVSEVLSGTRRLTMPMARALHEHLGIPADVLLRESNISPPDTVASVDWGRFPLKAMAQAGWIPNVSNLKAHAEDFVRDLIRKAGVSEGALATALYRKSDTSRRINAKTDSYALKAWCWRVLAEAARRSDLPHYETGTITPDFLRKVARLSWSENGPRLAREFLRKHGLPLVLVRHLPRTHLDGAVLTAADGRPVVGLTLRYDRLDNFWFCLVHEMAHIGRHLDTGLSKAFVDDLTLREVGGDSDPFESQADEWAEEALVPRSSWNASEVRRRPTPMAVVNLAKSLQVHPAIIAGKIRYELKNYRMLSNFVGTGEVRRQLETVDE
jgi:HTH-type transcriptional regulator/antitoxin HigA